MGLFKSIAKVIKKIVKTPVNMIRNAFKGDPLAIVSLIAAVYGGYSLLAQSGITAAGAAAAESAVASAPDAGFGLAMSQVSPAAVTAAETGAISGMGASELAALATPEAAMTGGGFGQAMAQTAQAATDTKSGLFGGIKNWWGKLEPKDKLMAVGMGVKTAGSFMKGIQEDKWRDRKYKLMKRYVYGVGQYSAPKDFKEYLGKAKMWYETDSALQKKVDYIQKRMEDPEYARGFKTLAGLLANPKGADILKSDPTTSMYS